MYVCVNVCLWVHMFAYILSIHVCKSMCIHGDSHSFFQAGTAQPHTIEEDKQKTYSTLTSAAAAAATAAAVCSFCACVKRENEMEMERERNMIS